MFTVFTVYFSILELVRSGCKVRFPILSIIPFYFWKAKHPQPTVQLPGSSF